MTTLIPHSISHTWSISQLVATRDQIVSHYAVPLRNILFISLHNSCMPVHDSCMIVPCSCTLGIRWRPRAGARAPGGGLEYNEIEAETWPLMAPSFFANQLRRIPRRMKYVWLRIPLNSPPPNPQKKKIKKLVPPHTGQVSLGGGEDSQHVQKCGGGGGRQLPAWRRGEVGARLLLLGGEARPGGGAARAGQLPLGGEARRGGCEAARRGGSWFSACRRGGRGGCEGAAR